ncbi:NAD-dependent epimerase/dehydratase family protein [Neotabrizicola sp. sgz301269]|uniref:NAD-dependent epimerase/dehydratase family protein n=1 Tax=Neotabrizicola sp. sgz301269 TaxID=3276282 RepID=UPI00376F780A
MGVTLDGIDLVITGAGGRLGRLLLAAGRAASVPGLRLHAVGRNQNAHIQWDILTDPAPDWPLGAVVLHLAGVVRGDERSLAANEALVAPLTQACRRNRACGLLFVSTAAVYAPHSEAASETTPPAPQSAYGRAKLAAEAALSRHDPGCRVSILRLGNVIGADALLGPRPAAEVITLDPVPGQRGGPLRSWIGPQSLWTVLTHLAQALTRGDDLPDILNIAAAPPLPMADLLDASGRDWRFGPANPAVVPVAVMDTARLRALCPLPPVTPATLIAERAALRP